MRTATLASVIATITLLGVDLAIGQTVGGETIMRQKLTYAQAILEGVTARISRRSPPAPCRCWRSPIELNGMRSTGTTTWPSAWAFARRLMTWQTPLGGKVPTEWPTLTCG